MRGKRGGRTTGFELSARLAAWRHHTCGGLVAEPLPGSPHPYKYWLHYQKADASDYIRYDNERGKGDHRHIGSTVEPYCFESVKKLAQDFYADIMQALTTGGI